MFVPSLLGPAICHLFNMFVRREFFRKIIGLIVFVIISSVSVYAQFSIVKKRVLQADGLPAINYEIRSIDGLHKFASTDKGGYFSATFPDSLKEILITNTILTEVARLTQDSIIRMNHHEIDEVVVSAMQLPVQKRATGYSIQVIHKSDDNQTNDNLLTKLSGVSPGVTIQNSGGAPGQSVRIVIRGNNSLDPMANNQPVFFLNGMPLDNSTNPGFGSSESFAYSNHLVDINDNDISDITILKGAGASSLYGMQAANGAVLLNTKTAVHNGFHIQMSTGFNFDKVTKFPKQQTTYLAGWYGQPNYLSYNFPFHAFGPKADTMPGSQFYNNLENFFNTGLGNYQNFNITDKNETSDIYFSLANLSHDGVIPSSSYNRQNVLFQVGYNFTRKFRIEVLNQYSNSATVMIPQGNDAEITSGAIAQLYYYPTSINVLDYQKKDGTMNVYTPWVSNPIYLAKNYHSNDKVNRYLGMLTISYKPLKNSLIKSISGIDTYDDQRKRILPGPAGIDGEIPISSTGEIQLTTIKYRQLYNNSLIQYVLPINDFNITGVLGEELIVRSSKINDILGQQFNVPGFYDVSNTEDQRYLSTETDKNNAAIYGEAILSYKNYWFTTLTGRQDWTSTLPEQNRSFFYPSVNSSLIFTELPFIQNFSKLIGLNQGQFRISYAEAGKDARPYQTGAYYSYYNHFNSSVAFTKNQNVGSLDLKPERSHSFETGLFLSMVNNRLQTDLTYYHTLSNDLIVSIPISFTTGFENYTTNAGSILNKGLELQLSGTIIQSNTFSWQMTVGYSKNINRVVRLAEGLNYIELPGSSYMYGGPVTIRLDEGYAYGNIYGTSYLRSTIGKDNNEIDKNAPLLIDSKGFPVVDYQPKILGNIQPDYILTLTNTLKFHNFKLDALFEFKKGGDVFNEPESFFAAQGTSMETANRDKTQLFEGVDENGNPNTKEVWLGQGVYGGDGVNYGDGYYRNVYRKVAENFVVDASWLKLRDARLSYVFNKSFGILQQFSCFAGISNLIIRTPFKGFDPEESQYGAGSNIQGLQGRGNPPVTSSYIGLSFNF